jgi:hypothetical protein
MAHKTKTTSSSLSLAKLRKITMTSKWKNWKLRMTHKKKKKQKSNSLKRTMSKTWACTLNKSRVKRKNKLMKAANHLTKASKTKIWKKSTIQKSKQICPRHLLVNNQWRASTPASVKFQTNNIKSRSRLQLSVRPVAKAAICWDLARNKCLK